MKNEIVFYDNIGISCTVSDNDKPAIVLLHGNSLSSLSFKEQFSDENLKDFGLIAIDFPGHGNSGRVKNPEHNYNLFYFRDAILYVLKYLGIENFILAGHSLGGHVAMECLPFVEKCNGLVIWSAPPVKLPLNFQEIFLSNPLQGLLFKKDLSESETDQLAGILADEKHFTMLKEMIRATDPAFREALPASLARQMVSDESKLLTESGLPVAIFHGEYDSLINYDYYQNLAIPDLWNQKATLIRNASHSPHIEAPREFNRFLVQFISDVNY